MKIAKEIYVDNRVRTVIECTMCGSTTYVKAGMDTKTSKDAIERSCTNCRPRPPFVYEGWWKEFGLKKNPYIYGPMPSVPVRGIAWRRRDVWDIGLGSGRMNTQKKEKESQSHD